MGSGRCICGAVAFEVTGPLRDVVQCHCTECRRWAGHAWAASEAMEKVRGFAGAGGVRWCGRPKRGWDARRGFCAECGSSLFWQVPGSDDVSIAAGCLDATTGVRTTHQVWVQSAGDYYDLDESIPSHQQGGGG